MKDQAQNPRIDQLRSFLRESPSDPFLLFALAKEFEKVGMKQEALDQYGALARDNPEYVATYYHYGSLLRDEGQEERAQEIFSLGMHYAGKAGDTHALSELQRIANTPTDFF